MPLLLRGTHAEETAEQRYVRAARARCPPPPPGDDLYDWRRGQEARASLIDARAAVEAYACLLDACVAAPGGVERCRLSAARADRDAKLAESEKLQELQEEVRNASTFEVAALLSAARRRLPFHSMRRGGRPRKPWSACKNTCPFRYAPAKSTRCRDSSTACVN